MARKLKKMQESRGDVAVLQTVKNSAGQIWLAGLGAYAMAQEGSSNLFQTLVEEGEATQQRAVKAAEERAAETKSKVVTLRKKAEGQWNRVEKVFEERVARALNRLGVPTREDVQQLMARVDELNANIAALIEEKKPSPRKGLSGSSERAA